MSDLILCENIFNSQARFTDRVYYPSTPGAEMVEYFDQNGYILTKLEQMYYKQNMSFYRGPWEYSCRQEWYYQKPKDRGAVLNHAFLFERKGYAGAALHQLQQWAKTNPLIYKVINIKPKWGVDISIDYVDEDGNSFEVFHYEWDGFDLNEIEVKRQTCQHLIENTDWDDAAKTLLKRKEEWYDLDFFAQSKWKSDFFGMSEERFKLVIWE